MFDPLLWSHEVMLHVYDISTGLQPISTRDQIVRGALLVRRAWQAGIITTQAEHGVLVVGAGVGGVAVALQAASMSIPVTLIEKRPYPFFRQRFCTTRTIDATLYDWPAAHWRATRHPWHPMDAPPLTVPLGHANEDARDWKKTLDHAAQTYPHLQVRYQTRLMNFPPTPTDSLYEATLSDKTSARFAMIVLATGVGRERRKNAKFRSYRFWDTDRLEDVRGEDRVLISGGGDGALQDFLRVVLRPGTQSRRLVARLELSAEAMHSFQDWTAQAKGYFVWCAGVGHEHDCERFLQQEIAAFIDALLGGSRAQHVRDVLDECVRREPDLPSVQLAYPCGHFTRCYSVNRFLALLIARYLKVYRGHDTLRPFQGLSGVTCEHDLPPTPDRRACFRQLHTVRWQLQDCSLQPRAADPPDPEEFSVIVLRHGTRPEPLIIPGMQNQLARPDNKNTRHVLPYHLGHLL